ncbi:hypothetical protein INT47_002632 [Mucor saturninus]|uniref:Protoporphyrinogen oxidase n=1 Tax=Mucor saturninus TaxID=64648 RepID=A0A8H7R6C7_9FUNG|nr:hypothetical protein INT47_002632 [Mucor saturninus]
MSQSVAIVGGGISGLSAAYYLARLAPTSTKITLIEGKERVGGWIKSQRATTPSILFEGGARTLRPKGETGTILLEMIQHLKLHDELVCVPQTDASAQHRYIYYKNEINTLPSNLTSAVFKKPPVMKSVLLAGLLEPFRKSRFAKDGTTKDGKEDESVYDFMRRRFNEDTALNLMGALTHGIYAGDIKTLSLQSTFRMLYEAEKNYGSVVVGMMKGAGNTSSMRERGMAVRARAHDPDWFSKMEKMNLIGFKKGMESLPQTLLSYLKECDNVRIVTQDPVQSITQLDNESKIKTRGGEELYADHVISTIPSFSLDRLIEGKLPHLSHNPSCDVAVVNLAYDGNTRLAQDGFGFLTPHRDTNGAKIPVPGTLGVIFDSNVLKEEEARVTVMMGGADWKDAFKVGIDQVTEKEAYEKAKTVMSAFLNIQNEPKAWMVHLQKQCIPQYLVGHQSRMRQLHQALTEVYGHRLSVTGASYMGVSVPDCIKNSRMLVEELLVSGALGSQEKIVTGLGKTMTDDLKDSRRLSKGNSSVIMMA